MLESVEMIHRSLRVSGRAENGAFVVL